MLVDMNSIYLVGNGYFLGVVIAIARFWRLHKKRNIKT